MLGDTEPVEDKTYSAASARAMGRVMGEYMQGLIEGGMTRSEAHDATKFYIAALLAQPRADPPKDDKDD